MTSTHTDIYDLVIEALVDAGFEPLDGYEPEGRMAEQVALWFEERGFDAIRSDTDGFTFARFSGEGMKLTATTPSGAIRSEASFDATDRGIAWFAAAAAA